MNPSRPEIPEAIKRDVRQRCGFGCVVCGIPVYHYDHIAEYSSVKAHSAENITLLCGYHHDLKTRGQLPTEAVRASNANPQNVSHGHTAVHPLFYFGDKAEIVAGGNRVVASSRSASAVRIDGHSLVGFELVDGELMLNLAFHDRDGAPTLTVNRNELTHSTHLWDYQFVGQKLSIWERQRQIYLTIAFATDQHRVVIEKGLVSHNGIDLFFDPRGLCILNNRTLLSGNTLIGTDTAISVGADGAGAGPSAVRIELNRGSYDRAGAIAWARENMDGRSSESHDNQQPAWGTRPTTLMSSLGCRRNILSCGRPI